ncbi:biopolymer transport protein ExbD [Neolewinella xylanilytica]|uniref:Biopolymer transport protein ExbD n=1 Tax=Neolewinella xylanilytica TaxID=1514080 RepID=A0A2S6IAJ7_9BACT|nr:biopolymer transporter ExbD [Neolewinella xylanilytica]PPK88523.1 biopolymer transport protein ExbD [Neolewinella xylanilytica]
MVFKTTRRDTPAVHAGSMADIAFLLLIFFLVTTTIDQDSGIIMKLPAWEANPPTTPTSEVLSVIVNADNAIMVEGEPAGVGELPRLLEQYVLDPRRTPRQAVVSLVHDRNTDYRHYLEVYDGLLSGYRRLWDAAGHSDYGDNYEALGEAQKQRIRQQFPMVISEAEPSDIRD